MRISEMVRCVALLLFGVILTTSSASAESLKAKTIAEFEGSTFFNKQTLQSKDSWDLRSGGRNNSYTFRDAENHYSSFGVEITTVGKDVVEISIHWNGESIYRPARISTLKIEMLKDLASYWGVAKQADQIIDYAKSQQSKRYAGGSSQAPRVRIGKIAIHCGTTGETLWVGWK